MPFPLRLVSSEEKVEAIKDCWCKGCFLTRRTNIKEGLTPGDELGVDVWSSKDIFGLSVNLDICHKLNPPIETHKEDVNIISEVKDVLFLDDRQLDSFDVESINAIKTNTLILIINVSDMLSVVGTYPIAKATPNETNHKFELRLEYKPMVLNVFHFQVEVYSDQKGKWEKVERENRKKYLRTLATKIRATILRDKLLKPAMPSAL